MEKTKFEIRKSVLAECETICKDPMQCYGIGDGLKISKSSSQYVIEYQDDRGSWWILATINRHTESSASLVLTFYSLLGLDKRDALEAAREEKKADDVKIQWMRETIQSLQQQLDAEKEKSKRWESRAWKILQIVRQPSHRSRPKTAAVLRTLREVSEKNERLVEMLEEIKYEDEVNGKGWENNHNSTYSRLCRVLEAYKEGKKDA